MFKGFKVPISYFAKIPLPPIDKDTVINNYYGTSLDISASISPIRDKNGVIIGTSTLSRDITEQKNLDKN